jgi:hypothetical protein
MQRWAISIGFTVLIAALTSPVTRAAESDDLGCHLDEITDSYFCSSGPLEGREFLTKAELDEAIQTFKNKAEAEEAERAKEALPPPPPPSDLLKDASDTTSKKGEKPANGNLKVMSWNMKALAGEDSDYDRAAMVLGQADIVALQEVDLHGQGKGFLNVIANLMQEKLKQKICRAWIQAESGERQTHGFLWKESTVGYVDEGGAINETCGASATVIHQPKKAKLASQATFYFKPQKKMFVLGNTFVDSKPKSPEKSVSEIFKSLDEGKWPIVLAGDLKMSAANAAFKGAKKLGFHSAMKGTDKAWDNIWYRGATLNEASRVDLYREFSDIRHEDIQKNFSGIFPVMAEFRLQAEAPTDSVDLVSKAKAPPAVKKKAKTKKKASKRKS